MLDYIHQRFIAILAISIDVIFSLQFAFVIANAICNCNKKKFCNRRYIEIKQISAVSV